MVYVSHPVAVVRSLGNHYIQILQQLDAIIVYGCICTW
jgi:hypothetical protein